MRLSTHPSASGLTRRQVLGRAAGAGLAALTVTLSSCGSPQKGPGGQEGGHKTGPRVYILDGGTIDILKWELFQPDAPVGTRRRLSAPAYVVIHPEGSLIWDTGLGDTIANRPGGVPVADMAIFHVQNSLAAQLRTIGLSPEKVDLLALSHFHPDHVGNVGLFTKSTLLVQQAEYDAAFTSSPCCGFDPTGYSSLRTSSAIKLNGDYDVFNDGSVVIKSLPGHTPGSQSLLVRLPTMGPVLISGDLVHSRDNWKRRVVPSINWNATRSQKSMEIAAGLVADEGAVLWVQHDLDQYAALRRAPAYYE